MHTLKTLNVLPVYMITQLIVLALAILFFIIAILFVKNIVKILFNSLIGFFALIAAALFLPDLVINIWSVLIVAFGGIFGFIAVILLHLLGWAF